MLFNKNDWWEAVKKAFDHSDMDMFEQTQLITGIVLTNEVIETTVLQYFIN